MSNEDRYLETIKNRIKYTTRAAVMETADWCYKDDEIRKMHVEWRRSRITVSIG